MAMGVMAVVGVATCQCFSPIDWGFVGGIGLHPKLKLPECGARNHGTKVPYGEGFSIRASYRLGHHIRRSASPESIRRNRARPCPEIWRALPSNDLMVEFAFEKAADKDAISDLQIWS